MQKNRLVRHKSAVFSAILSYFTFMSYAHAAPNGGSIVGGSGSINTNGLITNINQLSSSMAIDWNSFNLNSNEVVNFLQPGISAISLNRILGSDASQIHGQINANGQVVLVNPNGLFFGQNAFINVGGIIASGLDIDPVDFMNGDFIFNEVIGTDGAVINNGIINASLGGSVTLLGHQVKNEGVINAKLGSVNLAAGKEAVLTFDSDGLVGVRVSREILQDELGIDAAVVNNGEINASGGRVLLTASVSRDVFSEAVNHGGLEQATSAVVNEDGSFTLGGGADVVNAGSLNVSTDEIVQDAGQIIVLGENITSSGGIEANAKNGIGGSIELSSQNITLLTGDSYTNAVSESNGEGGDIKVLGNQVGILDQSTLDTSGANGGGEILIGGDYQGSNSNIRNSSYTFVDSKILINNDANTKGDGGKTILWSDKDTIFLGVVSATGGSDSGNGGFVEVSGKEHLLYTGSTNRSALNGFSGTLLLDPDNITIQPAGSNDSELDDGTINFGDSGGSDFTISVTKIATELGSGDVLLEASQMITFDADLDYNNSGTNSLTLDALGGITFTFGSSILDSNNSDDSLSVNLFSNGIVNMNNAIINTQGGTFTVGGPSGNTPTTFINNGTIDTSGIDGPNETTAATDAGNIDITASGAVISGVLTAAGGTNFITNNIGNALDGADGGNITINASSISISNSINTAGSILRFDFGDGVGSAINGAGGNVTLETAGSVNVSIGSTINTQGGDFIVGSTDVPIDFINNGTINTSGLDSTNDEIPSGNAGDINITVNGAFASSGLTATGGTNFLTDDHGLHINGTNGGDITINAGTVVFNGDINNNGSMARFDTDDGGGGATGGNGGDILISAGTGNISIAGLNNNGGDGAGQFGTLSPDEPGNGGNAGKITLDSQSGAGTVTLGGGITTVGGGGIGGGTAGVKGDITIDGTLTVSNDLVVDANNFTSGNIDASGAIDANGNNLNITADTSISVGALNTGGGLALANGGAGKNGGRVDLDAMNIEVGTITSTGSNAIAFPLLPIPLSGGAGGTINITATNNTGIKSVILNGDVNASGGVGVSGGTTGLAGTATVTLDGTATGNFTTNHAGSFTTGFTITSNNGSDDTFNAANLNNTWDVTADNEGTLNGNASFFSFENLVGGNLNDSFTLNNGVTLDGIINGGTAGSNTITRTDGTNIWVLTSANAGTLTGTGGFSNIQTLIGGIDDDTLAAINQPNSWNIIIAGVGTVENSVSATDQVLFTGMENLTGGTDTDIFTFNAGTAISGLVDGNTGLDTLDITALPATTVQVGNIVPNANLNITDIETVTANTTVANTLIGENINNTWDINAENAGSLNGTLNFSGFRNLVGGLGNDDFVFSGATGRLTLGSIDGGSSGGGVVNTVTGRNTINNWNLNIVDGGILTYDSTTTTLSSVQTFIGGSAADTLVGSVGIANTWDITGADSGTVTGLSDGFSNMDNLVGNINIDTFNLTGGSLSGNINGAAGSDIINADVGTNTWQVTGVNSGTVTGIGTFINIENLNGNSDADNFTLVSGSISGAIDGGLGANTLQAINQINTWNIDGPDQGNVTGIGTGFDNIQTLTGGTLADTFIFTDAGSMSGLVSGNSGTDTIFITAESSDLTVQVGNLVNSNLNIVEFEALNANGANANTLIADDITNSWQVTSANGGSLNGMTFTGFKRLIGGLLSEDTFVFQNGWSVENGIDASGGFDIADGSGVTSTQVFQIGMGSLENFESFIGNNNGSTLIGDDINNTWNITGTNSGVVGAIAFAGFDLLNGNDQIDIFQVTGNGALTGQANGGLGADIANITLSGIETGSFRFDGGSDIDAINLIGGNVDYQGQYDSDIAGFEQFSYNGTNSYVVQYRQTETVTNNLVAASLSLNGTSGNDTFNIGNNTFTVNSATTVNYNGFGVNSNFIVDGQTGIDGINSVAGLPVIADILQIANVDSIGSIGNALGTSVNQLELNNVTGDVFINELNQINLGQLNNVTGQLTLTNQSGDIQDSADIQTNANLQLTAQNGNIQLNNPNQFGGELNLDATNGNIDIANTIDTQLADVSAQNLIIDSGGNITQTVSAQIQTTGSTTLTANGADITLDGNNHLFTSLTVSDASNLTLVDSNASGLNLTDIAVTGNADLTSSGNLNTRQVTAGGDVSLTTSGAVIDANNNTSNNITATTLKIRSSSGIGSSDAIETQAQTLDVVNNGTGNVVITQSGIVNLTALQNDSINGGITFSSNRDINFNPNSTFSSGDLNMTTTSGSFLGLGAADINNPDITAQNARFIGLAGTFGSFSRSLTLNVPGTVLIQTRGAFDPQFVPPGPSSLTSTGINFTALSAVSAVAGEQLVEIETLSEVDPAIFTALRNYNQEEIAIRMPRDQLYDDELEDDEATQ